MTIELTTINLQHHPTTDEYDEFPKPAQLDGELDHNSSSLTKLGAWNLYLSHALSTWNGRTYEFGAVSNFFQILFNFPLPRFQTDRQTDKWMNVPLPFMQGKLSQARIKEVLLIFKCRRWLPLFIDLIHGFCLSTYLICTIDAVRLPAPSPYHKFLSPQTPPQNQGQCLRGWRMC